MRFLKQFAALLVVAAVCAFSTGCTVKEDKEAVAIFNKLMGYWEVAHIYETDDYYYLDENIPYHDENDYDVTQENEEYAVLRFTPEYVTFVATADPEVADYIGVPVPYSVTSDGKLYSYITRGDFTDHVTIEFRGDDVLLMYLDDEGTDEDMHSDYHSITTFRRVGGE